MTDNDATTTPPVTNNANRLQEIEERYQNVDAGPWKWSHCYGIGNRVHWALESPKSAAEGKVVSYLAVLHHAYPKSFGESVEDDPYLHFIAHSRDDTEWLCKRVRELEAIIAYIDDVAPRADETCDEPGIKLSEAVRRAIRDGVAKDDFHG